jgi:peptidoglycan hydrolase CwlO-like protein
MTSPFHDSPATKADLVPIQDAITALARALARGIKKLERMIMATQAEIDAVTAALVQEDSDLNTAVANLTAADTAIENQIAALQQANPALDLSGLQAELTKSQAASAAVASAVAATAAIVPAPPAGP